MKTYTNTICSVGIKVLISDLIATLTEDNWHVIENAFRSGHLDGCDFDDDDTLYFDKYQDFLDDITMDHLEDKLRHYDLLDKILLVPYCDLIKTHKSKDYPMGASAPISAFTENTIHDIRNRYHFLHNYDIVYMLNEYTL